MSDRKLIYILNHYSEGSSSHFFHILHLLNCMANNGVEISLIIEKMEGRPPIQHSSVHLYHLKKKGNVARRVELFFVLKHLRKKGFRKIFVRITSITASLAILFTKFYSAEVYYWHSGQTLEYDIAQPFGVKKIKWFIKSYLPFWFVKTFTHFFVTGPESMKKYYIEKAGVKKDKIIILYNDVDIHRFHKATEIERIYFRNKYGIPAEKKVILFVHRLSPVRQTHFYIPYIFDVLFNETDDALIYIIGDGAERRKIEEELGAKKYAEKIKFLGNIPNRQIHDYYKLGDLFINPTYVEGFPRVVIEAMASGLPILTTDAGGISDILGDKQKSFMVPRSDKNEFAARLVELISDPNDLQILSNENLQVVKKFSTEEVSKMYIEKIFGNELI